MKSKLTEGNILKQLIDLTLPMIVGLVAVIGFNVVDTYFVGKLGKLQLAAMSFTFPVAMVIASVAMGLSTGVSSLISRCLGAGYSSELKQYATDSLSLSLAIILILSLVGVLTIDPLFKLLGATEQTLPYIRDYMEIWYLNMPLLVIPMVGNGVIRATGDTKFPAIVMIVAGVVNAIFDPILIFGLFGFPRLEIQGAALATVISRVFTLIAALYILIYREKLLINPVRKFSEIYPNWKQLLTISIPAALNNLVVPISMGIITAMVAKYGSSTIAGFGVGTRVEGLILILPIAFAVSMGPFVGQNWGAKKIQRIQKAIQIGLVFSVGFVSLVSLFVFVLSSKIGLLFSQDIVVVSIASTYLRIVTISLVGECLLLMVSGSLNAMGKTKSSLLFSLLRMLFLYLPLAFILERFYFEKGIFYAAFIANIVVGALSLLYLKVILSKKKAALLLNKSPIGGVI